MQQFQINNIVILGAGVMGAQIAAHFSNCNFNVVLFDLPGRAAMALDVLKKLKPSPMVDNNVLNKITVADFDNLEDLNKIKKADLIIEAVAENIEIKNNLYSKIKPYWNDHALFCSNTSGLSINNLANILNNNPRFCGVHFFNPPRYQKLVELIPHKATDPDVLDNLETFLTRYLGKGVIRANDTPNFIANRIGVFSMLAAMYNADKFNLRFDLVDLLTGELIGRPKSATFRTADVVGLDTLASVINTMDKQCTDDPWHEYLKVPKYLSDLINKKHLGQKTGKGFYFKNNKNIEVYDKATDSYLLSELSVKNIDQKLLEILKIKNNFEKFNALKNYNNDQAQFLWACFRDLWHYTAYHLNDISGSVRDVDCALKWGFGWQQGPFELWQACGWQEITKLINDDIHANKALVTTELPQWVISEKCSKGVYKADLAYNSRLDEFTKASSLDVYTRQYVANKFDQGFKILLENNDAKLWLYNNNYVFSFKTKANVITSNVISLLNSSLDHINSAQLEKSLIIWQDNGDNFCAGADLNGFMGCVYQDDYITMDNTLIAFQNVCQRLRYTSFPVVAAVKGMILGGGTELMMHCDHVVASLESYIGLVEVGVGVIPAGGGCKEMLLRADKNYRYLFPNGNNGTSFADQDKITERYYKNIATALVSTSARDAIMLGYLRQTDTIITNPQELLTTAISAVNNLNYSNYIPPCPTKIRVGGLRLNANIYALLANYLEGKFISEHDHNISRQLAYVFSGGDIESDFEVSEQWLLDLERQVFINLLKTSATQARIDSLLKTGKPLRN